MQILNLGRVAGSEVCRLVGVPSSNVTQEPPASFCDSDVSYCYVETDADA